MFFMCSDMRNNYFSCISIEFNNLNAINKNAEKSTLGDLDALAELKEKMDKKK